MSDEDEKVEQLRKAMMSSDPLDILSTIYNQFKAVHQRESFEQLAATLEISVEKFDEWAKTRKFIEKN